MLDPNRFDVKALSDSELEAMLSRLSFHPLGMTAEENFRLTPAGAQRKTGLRRVDGVWCVPLAATPTSHIIKVALGKMPFDGMVLDFSESCENEWLCLEVARAFGLPAARSEILCVGTVKALAVERFERRLKSSDANVLLRLPIEDMCQALGVPASQKYEVDGGPGIVAVMALLRKSLKRLEDQRTFTAAQVLLWLLDSTDGHAKNYSIFIEQNDGFSLTPLYDLLSVAPLREQGLSPKRTSLAMALIGKNRYRRMPDIEPRHFISTAEAAGFSKTEMMAVLERFVDMGPKAKDELRMRLPAGFSQTTSETILKTVEMRLAKLKHFLDVQNDEGPYARTQTPA